MSLYAPPFQIIVPEQTYTGSIVWTGGAAPSSTTTHTYEWSQFSKLVTLRINLKYAVAGTTDTAVTMALPTDCPTPFAPTGFTSADQNMLCGVGGVNTSATATGATNQRVFLRANSGNNGYLVAVYCASQAAIVVNVTVQYWTA